MKTILLKIFAFLFTFGLLLTSCDVDLSSPKVDDETVLDNTLGERVVGDVFGMVNAGATSVKANESCGDFSFNGVDNTLTITFPDGGCEGADGITRSGVIHAQYNGTWLQVGSSVEISFDNYKQNEKELSGTITVLFSSGGTQPVFNMTASNMSLTYSDGGQITWESSNTYTWTAGVLTLFDRSDDFYTISGVTEGVARNGNEYTRVVTDLVKSPGCKWFTSGNILLTITEDTTNSIYDITFIEPCGTVTIRYNGISFTRIFD
jgi:hypothetical protein